MGTREAFSSTLATGLSAGDRIGRGEWVRGNVWQLVMLELVDDGSHGGNLYYHGDRNEREFDSLCSSDIYCELNQLDSGKMSRDGAHSSRSRILSHRLRPAQHGWGLWAPSSCGWRARFNFRRRVVEGASAERLRLGMPQVCPKRWRKIALSQRRHGADLPGSVENGSCEVLGCARAGKHCFWIAMA